jgi:2-haloacid dehalogenase
MQKIVVTAPVYVFDAYGTLFDVHSAVARHRDLVGSQADRMSALWRTKQLEYTWTRTLMEAYRDFDALTADALDFAAAACGGITAQARATLLDAYATLSAYPDVVPTLKALRARGARAVILSNGTARTLVGAMHNAGLTDLLDAPLSVDPLQRYKTVAQAYDMVCGAYGVSADAVSFQSSNRWDIAGAKRFGFHTVWINRSGAPDEYSDLPADRSITSLSEL